MYYVHIKLNYVMVINLYPLTQSTRIAVVNLWIANFRPNLLVIWISNGEYNRKGILLCLLKALYYARICFYAVPVLYYENYAGIICQGLGEMAYVVH